MNSRFTELFTEDKGTMKKDNKKRKYDIRNEFYHKAVSNGRHPRSFDRRFRTDLWTYVGESKNRAGNVKLGQHLFDVTEYKSKAHGISLECANGFKKAQKYQKATNMSSTKNSANEAIKMKEISQNNIAHSNQRYNTRYLS